MVLQQVLPDQFRDMIFTRQLRHAAIFLRVSADICLQQDLTLKKENIKPFMERFETVC